MKWYTSDLHFSYEKIINLCNRPFKKAVEKAVFEPVFQNRNARKLSWDGFSNL